MAFNIEFERKENLKVIPIGELDITTTSQFKEEVIKKYLEEKSNIIIDGSKLEYIDSTGLGALIYILNQLKEDGFEIKVEEVKPSIKKLFTITKLDTVFKMGE
ncbi:STAS domain-containing protein [Peptoniphilus indolicus]|uniref:Anti-sigma factor antagonist n=2 Tax=Peptoniphilus indolicus TaxID=33030 RepID=G4D1R7_9FIRM|nr:STAS domain-containing protein [Peptoniphilus indolicus]EGY80515.1 anti-sigma B factor antagonist [Peptoniphilus indolicus ATCC 29427]SUB75570.1 Putative anti-sigma factor antagonist TM_1442 [Peptoniphilus indolicus]